jgi:tetratricopeptide (TPR) repeat protein
LNDGGVRMVSGNTQSSHIRISSLKKALAAASFITLVFSVSASAVVEGYKTIAVIDYTERLSAADTELTMAVNRVISYRIESLPDASLVPDSELEMYLSSSNLGAIWNLDRNEAGQLCKLANADVLLLGRHSKTAGAVNSEFAAIACAAKGAEPKSRFKFKTAFGNIENFQKKIFDGVVGKTSIGVPPGFWKHQNVMRGAKAFERFGEGLRLIAAQRQDAGLAAIREALGAAPDSRDIHYFLGRYYATRQFNYERAVFHLNKVLDKYPDDPCAHYWLGFTYYLQGDYEVARGEFERAKVLNPISVETALMLATLYEDAGNYDAVVANYRDALKHAPRRASIWYSLASALAIEGRSDEAVEALSHALNLDRDAFFDLAKTDSDLAPIRKTQGFRKLLEEFKK